jgi:acylphosphatase
MDEKQLKIIVTGRVQMVGFRWYAKQHADMLGIKGYVRNVSRGEVEIIARGGDRELDTFIDYLKKGPSRSGVERVKKEECYKADDFNEFSIKM